MNVKIVLKRRVVSGDDQSALRHRVVVANLPRRGLIARQVPGEVDLEVPRLHHHGFILHVGRKGDRDPPGRVSVLLTDIVRAGTVSIDEREITAVVGDGGLD